MTTIIIFLILIPILALLLLMVNRFLALHVPYQAKNSPFECGFSSYEQTRAPAAVNYYEYAFFFILFELELLLSYPVGVSLYTIEEQGFGVMIMFFILLTLGFIYELGKNALCLESKQMFNFPDKLYFEEDNTINSVSNIPVFKQKILFSGFTFNIRKEFLFLLIALIVVGFTLYTVCVDFAVTSVFSNQYFKVSILCFILNVTVYIGYICISKKNLYYPLKNKEQYLLYLYMPLSGT